jgi:aryl-alcohol dehydrogenase-like predicted oxidoreductase
MRALDDVIRSGKVLYVGVSDTPAWIVSRANTLAQLRGWSPFVGLQIQYNLLDRTPERDLLPMAKALDIAVTPWGVLGAGVLSGKYNSANKNSGHSRGDWSNGLLNERNFEIARTVETIARERDCSPSQVALSWVRQQPWGVMVPILGIRSLQQLQDNLGCLEVELSEAQLERLERVSQLELGFPHDFLRSDKVRQAVFGQTYPLIDRHR